MKPNSLARPPLLQSLKTAVRIQRYFSGGAEDWNISLGAHEMGGSG